MIAIDAMGGDFAPQVVVEGALRAAQRGIPISLFGDKSRITTILTSLDTRWKKLPIAIEPCTQVITMEEEPSRSVMRKKDSSLVQAAVAVKEGRAHALVSAGNSGAVLAASIFIIGRVPGVLRPAIGNFIPTQHRQVFCLDLGANTDCKADHLEQFAWMGHLYVQLVSKIKHPRIGLLSNGHEPYKGSFEVKQVYDRLQESKDLNFIGNIEARDIFDDTIDVLVTDGFVGNVLLKGIQGIIRSLFVWAHQEAQATLWSKIIGWCARPLFGALKKRVDYQKIGGAILLGVHHTVIVAHGSAQAQAITNAIIFAHDIVVTKRIVQFNQALEKYVNRKQTIMNTIKKKVTSLFTLQKGDSSYGKK